jgi:uncharacterized membrane protein
MVFKKITRKKVYLVLTVSLLMLTLGGLSFLMGSGWGQSTMWATTIYGVLVTCFLGLQIYAFVASQVVYDEDVEEAKFIVLEKEGIYEFAEEA